MDDVELALAEQLAARLRELRRSRGWTQAELAEHAELTPHYIALLETARKLPTLRTLGCLARALGTTAGDLLGSEPTPGDAWVNDVRRLAVAVPESIRPLIAGVLKLATRHKDESPRPRKRRRAQAAGGRRRTR